MTTYIILALILGAIGWVVYSAVRKQRTGGGGCCPSCSDCTGCPMSGQSDQQ